MIKKHENEDRICQKYDTTRHVTESKTEISFIFIFIIILILSESRLKYFPILKYNVPDGLVQGFLVRRLLRNLTDPQRLWLRAPDASWRFFSPGMENGHYFINRWLRFSNYVFALNLQVDRCAVCNEYRRLPTKPRKETDICMLISYRVHWYWDCHNAYKYYHHLNHRICRFCFFFGDVENFPKGEKVKVTLYLQSFSNPNFTTPFKILYKVALFSCTTYHHRWERRSWSMCACATFGCYPGYAPKISKVNGFFPS